MRTLISILVSIVAVCALSFTRAQERPHVPRIGYLAMGSITAPAFFVQKMAEQGYAAGQTASFEYRFAEGRHERLLPLARELVERQDDVLYAYGDEAIAAAQVATKTIPMHHYRAFREARCGLPRNGTTPKAPGRALQSREQEQADGLRTDARGGEFVRHRC